MARTAIGTNDFRSSALATPGFTMVRNVVYSGSLNVDICKPNTASRPAIILLHGGLLTGSRLDSPYLKLSPMFAEMGLAVFNGDYTITGGAPQVPINDVLTLVQWVRTNAATYNADPTRVAIVGISAGGFLGLMASITGTIGTTRPDAMVAWSPLCDLGDAWAYAPTILTSYMGFGYPGNVAAYNAKSPTKIVTSNCCPVRLIGSDTEPLTPEGAGLSRDQYDNLETAALAVGVSVTKLIFASTVHGFFYPNDLPGWQGPLDLAGTAAWIIRKMAEQVSSSNRTAASGRSASVSRTAA